MGKDQELLDAARNGNIPVVEKILTQRAKRSGPLASLRRGPGANVQDNSGYSALHHAALNGHKEVVQLLLAHEASTNIVDDKGSSPLHLAAWAGNVDVVRLLLTHGPSLPNVNLLTRDSETPLHCAAQYGLSEVVSLLLEHGCDPAIPNCRGETALDLAAQYGRLDTVERLVRTHPELIQPYSKGGAAFAVMFPHTPLHLASRNGHKAVVEVLLAAGVDVNVRTSSGTALHEAALCGKTEVVRTLLEAGVDLGIRDSGRHTVSELLRQFPAHVTHDISTLIQRHRQAIGGADSSDCDGLGDDDHLPSMANPNAGLGSPYENVRPSATGPMLVLRPTGPGGGRGSGGTSPTLWEPQHRNRSHTSSSVPEEHILHRLNAASIVSISSDSHHGGFLSDDPFVNRSRDREPDQLSVSSAASSTCGVGGHHRRGPSFCSNASDGIYLPMSGSCGAGTPSPGSNSKVSPGMLQPTPPKKPPRRNLSVSPTHPQLPHLSLSVDSTTLPSSTSAGAYEYLFLARSGTRGAEDEPQGSPGSVSSSSSRRDVLLRRGRSADQYVDMRLHAIDFESDSSSSSALLFAAAPAGYENVTLRTVNPRRKLRRNQDKHYDDTEPTSIAAVVAVRRPDANADLSPLAAARDGDGEVVLALTPKPKPRLLPTPLSPSHYQQPPTPDHPPPSAAAAERSIHERIRPLSQVSPPRQALCGCNIPSTSMHAVPIGITVLDRIAEVCISPRNNGGHVI